MRLLSITVRNYRIHRDLTVALDPSRTVIGGPNESGKSTLVEAAHRALFLRAKISGEAQKEMVSSLHPGHPEVEVTFSVGRRSYRILKRFSGASGTATLTESGGSTLQGEEAEARLAELLGVTEVSGGRGAADRIVHQWAHLWVWQGKAGSDPSNPADDATRDRLLARLQANGGAAVMQSDLDARVARSIAEAVELVYTQKNIARRESDLGRAMGEETTAIAALAEATAAVTRLDQAIVDFQESEQAIAEHRRLLESLQPQMDEVTAREKQIAALQSTEKEHAVQADSALQEYRALQSADAQIRTLRSDIQTRTETLAPRVQKTEQLRASAQERQQRVEQAEAALQQAITSARSIRLRQSLAQAALTRFEKIAALAELESKRQQVVGLRARLAELEAQAATLPQVKPSHLKRLQKLETTRSNAEAALQAMAAGVELLASDTPVKVAGQTLPVGGTRVLTEEAELQIGSGVTVRIRPGGGDALATARATLHESRNELQGELDALGVPSTGAAADAIARHQQLGGEIETLRKNLELLASHTLDADLARAATQRVAAEADVTSRLAAIQIESDPVTSDESEAGTAVIRLGRDLSFAEQAEGEFQSSRRALQKVVTEAREVLEEHQSSLQSEQNQLLEQGARLKLLVEQHGEETARGQRMTALEIRRDQASAAHSATLQSLAHLLPDRVNADRERIQRATQMQEDARQKAQERRASALTLLQSDGSLDPQAALAVADARARAASEHRAVAEKKAMALQTLDRLFREEQATLADQFTRPLAQKIGGYLECLFGAGVAVNLRLVDGKFDSLELTRSGHGSVATTGAFRFDALSAGAREQVAAAVRLAMAEVLAQADGEAGRGEGASETGDRCLPLVFDDAFAYSDPERVKTLQRMLDLGAERGLQIIVLSCTAADYASFGAQSIALRRPAVIPGPRAPVPAAQPAAGAAFSGVPLALEIPHIAPASPAAPIAPEASPTPGSPLSTTTTATPTPAQRERFLETLRAQGGKSGNVTLRAALAWDEVTYDAVKSDLIATRQILPGKGRGGSVLLPTPSTFL